MIWSVIPEEMIFENWEEKFEIQEKFINNRLVKVRVGSDGYGNIESVLSTNPQDFLNNNFCPGKKIKI